MKKTLPLPCFPLLLRVGNAGNSSSAHETHLLGLPFYSGRPQGMGIQDGVSRRVLKGDDIIIPGYTLHWFSNIESDLTYLITRPDPEGKMKLK